MAKKKSKKSSHGSGGSGILGDILGAIKGGGKDVVDFSKWVQQHMAATPNLASPHINSLAQDISGLGHLFSGGGGNSTPKSKSPNTKGLPNYQFPSIDPMTALSGQIISALQPAAGPITSQIANYSKDLAPFESMMPASIASIYQKNAPDIQQALGGLLASTTQAAESAPQADVLGTLLNAIKNYATSQAVYYSNPAPLKSMYGGGSSPGIQSLMSMLGQIGSGAGIGTSIQPIAPTKTSTKTQPYPNQLPPA